MKDDARAIVRRMPKDAKLCVANWGDRKTPIPDSVWHGEFSHLKISTGACSFALSALGREVQALLRESE